MRQDVGQGDIFNRKQRVEGIIYIYYYHVANFIQKWNCIFFLCAMAINDNKKKGDDVLICCSKCLKYPFFITITAVLINNCIVLCNINFFVFFRDLL